MVKTERGSRTRLVKWAAGAAVAGSTLGLVPVVAQAAVGTPQNVDVQVNNSAPSLEVDWDAPNVGTQVEYYRVEYDRNPDNDPATPFQVDGEVFRASWQTSASIAAAFNTTYDVRVVAVDYSDVAGNASAVVRRTTGPGPASCNAAQWTPFCTVDAFIRQQYADFLGRAPRLDELNQWRQYLGTDRGIGSRENQFINELREAQEIVAGPVIRLYRAYFLRSPEYAGYQYWLGAARTGGWSMEAMSEFFAGSTEFQNRYGALDDAEFISLVYNNVLQRQPDAAGQQYWERELANGRTRGWVMLQFSEAPSGEFQRKSGTIMMVTQMYGAMLKRMPTIAEYDAALTYVTGGWPFNATEMWPVYSTILNTTEYRNRINPN